MAAVAKYGIIVYSQAVCNYYFLYHSPQYQAHAAYGFIVAEIMFLVELVKHILRSLYWPCYQLRIEHYIQGVYTEIGLGLLVSTIHLYGITQSLESMERQAYGQNDVL